MKECPILFSTEMVQAILDGRKTKTRRVFKGFTPPENLKNDPLNICRIESGVAKWYYNDNLATHDGEWTKCKYGQVGDVLWVRETWRLTDFLHPSDDNYGYIYKASANGTEWESNSVGWKWKPSIHMPKEACRIRLKIKSIRVELLLDISEQDAIAEGIDYTQNGTPSEGYSAIWYKNYILNDCPFLKGNIKHSYNSSGSFSSAVMSYLTLWNKINGVDSHKQNQWVWVIEFERSME